MLTRDFFPFIHYSGIYLCVYFSLFKYVEVVGINDLFNAFE